VFSSDPDHLLSLHEGNAIRHWKIEERGAGQEPGLRETARARIMKGTPWRDRILLRPPYLASLTRYGLRLWDADSARLVAILPLPDEDWSYLSFSSNGRFAGA